MEIIKNTNRIFGGFSKECNASFCGIADYITTNTSSDGAQILIGNYSGLSTEQINELNSMFVSRLSEMKSINCLEAQGPIAENLSVSNFMEEPRDKLRSYVHFFNYYQAEIGC